MTQYVCVPERCLHALPPDLPFFRAALTEPCCVAYNAVCVNGRVRPGDTVLVLGPGPIGLLCALMARLSGARTVLVAGLPSDDRRLKVAGKMGFISILSDQILDTVRHMGDGLGVDVAVDSSGASAALRAALEAVRPAGQIIKVGWGAQPLQFSLDPMVQKNVTISGSFSHNWPVWERVLSMFTSGQIDLAPIISAVRPLSDWLSCFESMEQGAYVKAVLEP